MSMLAEKRTKKKWCLNPSGKDWSNDNNKFGQRMLEKMGWKKGCGLGVNLQGMKEHVRVSAKNDTKGLGCKNNYDTEWIHHQQNFENLLSELACTSFEGTRAPVPSVTKPVSLEEKSKKSRVRVHYQKFTRGKDVSRYSANDLACIFGKKCSSLDSKSFEMQYSCHTNTGNTSEADAEDGMTSDEHPFGQSSNLSKENTSDHRVLSLLPKHRVKDQPVYYRPEDKGEQEKQIDILKEISNVKEKSDMDMVEELKIKMEDNSANNFWPESVEKIRSKRKRKRVKDSENNQEALTEPTITGSQEEGSEFYTVACADEETDKVEKKEKSKKKKKDKKIKLKVDDENGKVDKKLCRVAIDVNSDAEEIGNEELEHASVISEVDTGGSKIKMKKICNVYETHISKKQKEHPKTKKMKKRKIATHSLNEPDVTITSEIVSPLPQDHRDRTNNTERTVSFTSESFSSYKKDPHQYDSNIFAKHRKAVKKPRRKKLGICFKGSNLDSIPGYGSL